MAHFTDDGGKHEEIWGSPALDIMADRASTDIAKKVVMKDGRALLHADDNVKEDRDIVIRAVQENAESFMFASEELRADREVALLAVTGLGETLRLVALHLME
ncbi:unnamed protein product, partial [Polarella glacialis]